MAIPLRVLIVEDSEADALLLLRELQRGGYEPAFERVETAESMARALNAGPWDIILSDYTLPRFSGTDALRLLHDHGLDIPFIFISGTMGEDTVVAAMKSGAQDYIIKGSFTRLTPAIQRELRDAETRRERKRMEQALLESEERYRTLAEAAQDIIFIMDRDGTIRYINIFGASMFKSLPEEIIGKPLTNLFPADISDQQNKEVSEVFAAGKDAYYELVLHFPDKEQWAHVHLTSLKDTAGNTKGILGIVRDITEHKKLEEQLRHAQKMEAIGQLAGGIAHDFRNILNAIIGFGNLIEKNMSKDDPGRAYIYEIINAGERAVNLTRNLLVLGRKQMLDLKPQNLNEIIQDLHKFLRRIIGEDITLEVGREGIKDLMIMADRGQIEQVLMNLATNARDAMPEGGHLTLQTGITQIGPEYIKNHGYGELGDYALLSVADTGMGIDKETREKIFEPFFTTKAMNKGTGLGLSIVYGIVKQHHGYINVYSEPQKGTTFKIYLPLYRGL
jgi:PAS domain S-box-containing protein